MGQENTNSNIAPDEFVRFFNSHILGKYTSHTIGISKNSKLSAKYIMFDYKFVESFLNTLPKKFIIFMHENKNELEKMGSKEINSILINVHEYIKNKMFEEKKQAIFSLLKLINENTTIYKHGIEWAFVGGTSLSYMVDIKRFSEDIDLALIYNEKNTPSKTFWKKALPLFVKDIIKIIEANGSGLFEGVVDVPESASKVLTSGEGNFITNLSIKYKSQWTGYVNVANFLNYIKIDVNSIKPTNKEYVDFIIKSPLDGRTSIKIKIRRPEYTAMDKLVSAWPHSDMTKIRNTVRHLYDVSKVLSNDEIFANFRNINFAEYKESILSIIKQEKNPIVSSAFQYISSSLLDEKVIRALEQFISDYSYDKTISGKMIVTKLLELKEKYES